ncbi:hypothetical protein IX51_05270 [uncultured archaeon]|nr:hypothetical protein IX51_05270 [uncultured archaeon]
MAKIVLKTDGDFRDVGMERKLLQDAGYELVERNCLTSMDVLEACRELNPDALIVLKAPINQEVMASATSVKAISRYGIGLDMIDMSAASEMGIPVAYVPDYCVDEVSNHAISLMFSAERRLLIFDRKVRKGDWSMDGIAPVHRFSEKTLGLLGFGRLSRAVAQKMKAFDVRLTSFDPLVKGEEMAALDVEKAETIDELLANSDIISIHVPLTRQTHGLIGKEALEKMKKGSVVINTSRGGIVDQKALLESIKTGHIASAGLDVFEEEPINPSDPILKESRIVLSPHVSYYSEEALSQVQSDTAQGIVDILRGKRPRNLANPEVWGKRRT